MNGWSGLTIFLAVPAVTSTIYFWVAGNRLTRWLSEEIPAGADDRSLPPVSFFRPLKAGVPDLPGKLAALARALRPDDQLLVGAEIGSAELAAAHALARTFSELDICPVPCERSATLNPKIAKLVQMEPFARHELWILSDCEAVMEAGFLIAFRREWTQSQCDVLTAGYRFSQIATWPQRLDAAAALLTLWPGLAMVRAFGPVRLTLGAGTGFRQSDLQAVGGWRAFAEDLAEDNRLGQALAAAGRKIRLSTQVLTLESDALSWLDYWRHQRRVAVTYRRANPVGFAGAWLSQGVTTCLLLACFRPLEIWVWTLLMVVFWSRFLTAWRATRELAFPISKLVPVVFLASLVETLCWGLSWGTSRVWWAGQWWRISRNGRLTLANPR